MGVLKLLRQHPEGMHFNAIRRALRTDPTTVARRLRDLTSRGFVKAKRGSDVSNYRITPRGLEAARLAEVIEALR